MNKKNIIIFFIYSIIVFFSYKNSVYADFDAPLILPTETGKNKKDQTSKPNNGKPLKDNATPKKEVKQNPSTKEQFTRHNSSSPITFKGDNASASPKNNHWVLDGNVVISQDETTLTSDKAQIFGFPKNETNKNNQNIEKALASGHVNIIKKSINSMPEIKATCDEVEFKVPNKILILKGKAKVWKGAEFIHASTITIDLNTGNISLQDPKGTVDPGKNDNAFK